MSHGPVQCPSPPPPSPRRSKSASTAVPVSMLQLSLRTSGVAGLLDDGPMPVQWLCRRVQPTMPSAQRRPVCMCFKCRLAGVTRRRRYLCPPAPPPTERHSGTSWSCVAQASTQMNWRTRSKLGLRVDAYRPLQYLTRNECRNPWPNRHHRDVRCGHQFVHSGRCTKLICATSCDESIGLISFE